MRFAQRPGWSTKVSVGRAGNWLNAATAQSTAARKATALLIPVHDVVGRCGDLQLEFVAVEDPQVLGLVGGGESDAAAQASIGVQQVDLLRGQMRVHPRIRRMLDQSVHAKDA